MCAVLRHVFLIMSEDKLHGGCSGKTGKKNRDEAIMWLDFRPWTVSKKKQDVQGLTLYVSVVPGLYLA